MKSDNPTLTRRGKQLQKNDERFALLNTDEEGLPDTHMPCKQGHEHAGRGLTHTCPANRDICTQVVAIEVRAWKGSQSDDSSQEVDGEAGGSIRRQ